MVKGPMAMNFDAVDGTNTNTVTKMPVKRFIRRKAGAGRAIAVVVMARVRTSLFTDESEVALSTDLVGAQ